MKRAIAAALFLIAAHAGAQNYYASPSGSGTACSAGVPCSLAYGLSSPSPANGPGKTLFLLNGTYTGAFTSELAGNASVQVIIRNYPGGQATIDSAGSSSNPLLVKGSYATFWGFEVKNSSATRPHTDFARPNGIQIAQDVSHPGLKFINLIIHDTGSGIGFWTQASDSEVYGCLIYYNGGTQLDHGIYTQNTTGYKKITDNTILNNYGHGFHAYGSTGAFFNNYDVQGNTLYNNGLLSSGTPQRNFLMGGDNASQNAIIKSNYLYYTQAQSPNGGFRLGYGGGCTNAVVQNNYFSNWIEFAGGCVPASFTGNTVYGLVNGISPASFPSNTYVNPPPPIPPNQPTVTQVFVRPNLYEPGRGKVTIYNWQNTATVNVDLSSILTVGSTYEIRNAGNYFGAAVGTGTYSGAAVAFPTTALSMATPVGYSAPAASGPQFNSYIVLTTSGFPTPTNTPSPTITYTPSITKTPTSSPTRTPTATKTFTPSITNTPPMGATNTFTYTPSNTATKTFTPTNTPTVGAVWHTELPLGDAVIVSPLPLQTAYGTSARTVTTYGMGTATWTFNVPYSSVVDFWAYTNATSPNSDSFYVSVDGGTEVTYDTAEGQWQPRFIWTTVCNRLTSAPYTPCGTNPVYFTLSAGSHTVRFRGREVGSQVAGLYVSSDPGFIPQVTPTPTFTASFTATASPTATFTPSPSNTPFSVCFTVTPSNTPTPSPTP